VGLDILDNLLRERGLGGVSRKGASLASHYAKVQNAFDRTAQYVNPRFRFVFLEDGTINGVAYSDLWRSYAGLTFGCVSVLETAFRLLFRNQHLLEHLPGGEDNEELRRDIQTTFHLAVVGIDRAEVPDSYFAGLKHSINPSRAELSYRLYKRALLFLYYHELSHLSRGHTKLCQAAGNNPLILEADSIVDKERYHFGARLWAELEADWLATIWLLQAEEWRDDERQNIDTLFELFFGIGIVCFIFSFSEEKAGCLNLDHPHPSIRLAHLVDETAGFLINGERYPFTNTLPIETAAEKALEELAIVGLLAGFDWYSSAEKVAAQAKQRIEAIRMEAGRAWVEVANRSMRKLVKRPPPKS
jgi:hypothetical protein